MKRCFRLPLQLAPAWSTFDGWRGWIELGVFILLVSRWLGWVARGKTISVVLVKCWQTHSFFSQQPPHPPLFTIHPFFSSYTHTPHTEYTGHLQRHICHPTLWPACPAAAFLKTTRGRFPCAKQQHEQTSTRPRLHYHIGQAGQGQQTTAGTCRQCLGSHASRPASALGTHRIDGTRDRGGGGRGGGRWQHRGRGGGPGPGDITTHPCLGLGAKAAWKGHVSVSAWPKRRGSRPV